MAACRFCKSELVVGARYCHVCEHYQSRWDDFWATFKIQDLVTLVSVTALAWTSLNAHLIHPKAEIKGYLLACTSGPAATSVQMALANAGNGQAFVSHGTLQRKIEGYEDPITYTLTARQPATLKAKDANIRDFVLARSLPRAIVEGTPKCTWEVTLDVIAFDGSPTSVVSSCACPV